MSPQRRTALVSVGAACLLVAIKLAAGLASSSLGLLAEAAHSGTDLAAALLTFFAVSVAVRPADRGHPYGHGKAQNLAALQGQINALDDGVPDVIAVAINLEALDVEEGFALDAFFFSDHREAHLFYARTNQLQNLPQQ